jgi:hypothetical protein
VKDRAYLKINVVANSDSDDIFGIGSQCCVLFSPFSASSKVLQALDLFPI